MFLVNLLIVAGLLVLAWWLLRGLDDFVIRSRPDAVTIKGRLSQAERARVAEFFRTEFAGEPPFAVSGRRLRDGRLRLRFRGRVARGTRQQIRNFLVTCL